MKYPFNDAALPIDERVRDLVSRLTVEEKIGMLTTRQKAVPRLGIGEWHIGAEVARGYVSRRPDSPTTVLPQPIGMSGMFDPDLMEKLGEIAGTEARILNSRDPRTHLMLWGPTVDACRDPRWGRNEESYGEDPYLTGQMSAAYTRGMAGDNPKYMRTIPTLKHFYANNNEEKRGSCSANIYPRTKNEYYHEFFRIPIEDGGAYSMMAAYNELSGVPAVVNPDIQSVVKDKWGLGFVVTDGGDFSQNVTAHHYSDSHAETLALALKAGTDIMTDSAELVAAAAREALSLGLITEADIDKSVTNSLTARFKLGEFDPKELNPYSDPDPALMDCEEHKKLNLLAAKEQTVLLKNSGVLPIRNKAKIAAVGLLAGEYRMDWYTGYSSYFVTPIDGLKKRFGEENVAYDDGLDRIVIRSNLTGKLLRADENGAITADGEAPGPDTLFIRNDWGGEVTYKLESTGKFFTTETMKADSDTTYRWFNREILRPEITPDGVRYITYFKDTQLGVTDGKLCSMPIKNPKPETLFTEEVISSGAERAAKLAASADVTLVFVGNDPMIIARECYDRTYLALPPQQKKLFEACEKSAKKTVLTIVSSYPYAVQDELTNADAAIYTSHAGPELGNSLAAVISGDCNPAGRLAQTWYRSEDELPSIFDYDIITNGTTYLYYEGEPLFPFGYGLSYSEFEYSGFKISHSAGSVRITLNVKNISETDGEEVVEVYFKPPKMRIKRPIKQLCAFKRVKLSAGETKSLSLEIKDSQLRFYDVSREKFSVIGGEYIFFAGPSSADERLSGSVRVPGESMPPRDLGANTKAINFDKRMGSQMKFSKRLNRHYMSGGAIEFYDVKFRGEHSAELYCSCPGGGKITLISGGEVIAEQRLQSTASPEGFTYMSVPIKPKRGVRDLTVRLENVNLVSLRLA